MKFRTKTWTTALLLGGLAATVAQAGEQPSIQRGRYLVATAGCNDCHTPGYMEKDGKVPVSEWLTGSSVGWQGPWGTSYPANLRLLFSTMTEKEWLEHSKKSFRPPMPSWALHEMSRTDLKALYRFIHSLGAAGEPAPTFVKPGGKVRTPYMDLTVHNLPPGAGI